MRSRRVMSASAPIVTLALVCMPLSSSLHGAIGVSQSRDLNGVDVTSAQSLQSASTGQVQVSASVATVVGGGQQFTYALPDGEVDSVTVPPTGFNPLTATPAQLAMYGFPQAPTSSAGLATWTAAMSAYTGDPAPSSTLNVSNSQGNQDTAGPVYDGAWAGYWAGTPGGGTKYTGVSAVFNTPNILDPSSGTCFDSGGNPTSMSTWVGLGGTSTTLVQEGVAWCNPILDPLGIPEWQPFTEFVMADNSKWNLTSVCLSPLWTVGMDHTIYLNLNYNTSTNVANFFVEDETTGVTHSCAAIPPGLGSWVFDGNTADFINEQPTAASADLPKYNAYLFGSDQGVLASNGSTVNLGNMSGIRNTYTGCSSSYSQYAGGIHSDQTDFSQYWTQPNYSC